MPVSVQYAQQPPGGSATDLGLTIDALTAKATPVDADEIALSDSAASAAGKKITFTQMWADYVKGKADALYVALSSYTASDVLTKIKTVDGSGSGLDADTLDGHDSTFFYSTSNPPPAGGQPIPTSSTFAVGSLAICGMVTGTLTDGSSTAGTNLKLGIPTSLSGTVQTGTWVNHHGTTISTSAGGYCVRTA